MSSISRDVTLIVQSTSLSDFQKIKQLKSVVTISNVAELALPISEIDDSYNVILYLIRIELIIAHSEDYSKLPDLFRELSLVPYLKNINSSSVSPQNFKETYIKTTYNDNLTDYQYLIQNPNNRKLLDLINKKMLLVSNLPSTDETYHDLNRLINLKILELFIISSYDFRKKNILKHLQEDMKLDTDESSPVTELVDLLASGRVIPFDLWQKALSSDFGNNYYFLIRRCMNTSQLIVNWLENNIVLLSKYYISIKISKVYQLFHISSDIEVEQVILDMVVHKKLPTNSKIDQIEGILVFGQEEGAETSSTTHSENYSINNLNEHISDVSHIINEIGLRLHS
ncbi:hypothetical protein G9P44_004756 [Scheffersomyces stipitis]|nr:hypothetical protein G9P44_004756 [Scheffersomyces stipitis]